MDKYEILAKSREENKKQDFFEQEIMLRASRYALLAMAALATVFFAVQIFVGGGVNLGIYALVFCGNMVINWLKFIKFHKKIYLFLAIGFTIIVIGASAQHIYNLISSSTIL